MYAMSYPGYQAQKKAILKYQKSHARIVLYVKKELKEELSKRAEEHGLSLPRYVLLALEALKTIEDQYDSFERKEEDHGS